MIAVELMKHALAAKQNIVFDEVGSSFDKLSKRARSLVGPETNYDVNLVHVDAPLEQSIKVVWDRFRGKGKVHRSGLPTE